MDIDSPAESGASLASRSSPLTSQEESNKSMRVNTLFSPKNKVSVPRKRDSEISQTLKVLVEEANDD